MAKKNKKASAPSSSKPKNQAASPQSGAAKPVETSAEIKPSVKAPEPIVTTTPVVVDAWHDKSPRFWQVAIVLMIVGIALRQAQLAWFPYSPDEAIHAWFSEDFATYKYDPIYHGPVLYHLVAASYCIFGKNDFSARLPSALLGIGLLVMVLGPARRWLGARGTLWTLALLAISPIMVTYQRRLIHDALVLALTLGAVLYFQRARENPAEGEEGRSARMGVVACLTLLVATKANAFFIIAMLLSFWIITDGRKLWAVTRTLVLKLPNWVPPLVFTVAVAATCIALRKPEMEERLRDAQAAYNQLGIDPNDSFRNFTLSLHTGFRQEKTYIMVCLCALGALWFWLMGGPQPAVQPVLPTAAPTAGDEKDGPASRPFVPSRERLLTLMAALGTFIFLFAFFYGHGVKWWGVPLDMLTKAKSFWPDFGKTVSEIFAFAGAGFKLSLLWLWQHTPLGRAEAESAVIWSANARPMMHAAEWQNVVDAVPKMLTYWVGQQGEPRLPGPHHYYIVLMLLYELPIVLAGVAGIVRASMKRTPFTDLLIWWTITSFVLYAVANEKVPWLLTHVMLPLTLLAGWWLGQLRPALGKFLTPTQHHVAVSVASVAGAVFLFRGTWATNFGRGVDMHEPMFYAQTTEAYRDELLGGLKTSAKKNPEGGFWLDGERQWPTVWYIRYVAPKPVFHKGKRLVVDGKEISTLADASPHLYGAKGGYSLSAIPDMRIAVVADEKWTGVASRFPHLQAHKTDFYIWPRASWDALRPALYWPWWYNRKTEKYDLDGKQLRPHFLKEWSASTVVVAY